MAEPSTNADAPYRELRCPLCDTALRVRLPESVRIVERDDDFCPRTLGPNPLLAAIHRCPGCGYCGSVAEFAPITDERKRKKLHRALAGTTQESLRTIRERYECRARLGVALGEPSHVVADAYLKAGWAARITGEAVELEHASLKKAVQYFELALQARDVAKPRVPQLAYLLAVLQLRLGRPDGARKWLAFLDAKTVPATWPSWLAPARARLAKRLANATDASE